MGEKTQEKHNFIPKFATAEEAVKAIIDFFSLKPIRIVMAVSGFVEACLPEELIKAISESFERTGFPNNIHLCFAAGMGSKARPEGGLNLLAKIGLITKLTAGHIGLVPMLRDMILKKILPAHLLPQDNILRMFACEALGQPYTHTQVGLGTYVDPWEKGSDGGRRNTDEQIVKHVIEGGEDFLRFKRLGLNLAIIRGSAFTTTGDLLVNEEPLKTELQDIVRAVLGNGGMVIAQAAKIVYEYSPHDVVVPGFAIHYAVVDPTQTMTFRTGYDKSFVSYRADYVPEEHAIPDLPIDVQIIGQSIASRVKPGDITNTGIGLRSEVWQHYIKMMGLDGKILSTVEPGVYGGHKSDAFGVQKNPVGIISHPHMFDYYRGGCLDVAVMSAIEIGPRGLNVSRAEKIGVYAGPGGFAGITSVARKVLFAFSLTAGGLIERIENGKLIIVQEGKNKKLVSKIQEMTFSYSQAIKNGQAILMCTDRCVFKLCSDGMLEIIEMAPGIDIETQVLPLIDFEVRVSPNLKEMRLPIFGNC